MKVAGVDLRRLRKKYNLSLNEAGVALGKSAITLDLWECRDTSVLSLNDIESAYQAHRERNPLPIATNSLFGHLPLRVARVILKLSLEEMARKYGFSKAPWTKFEAEARTLCGPVKEKVEADVRERMLYILKLPPP